MYFEVYIFAFRAWLRMAQLKNLLVYCKRAPTAAARHVLPSFRVHKRDGMIWLSLP